MTVPTHKSCAVCGASVAGNFCGNCGAPAGPRSCARCHAELSAQARFCHRCGTPVAGTPVGGTSAPVDARKPWLVAAAIVAVLLGGIIWKVSRGPTAPPTPDMANVGSTSGRVSARASASASDVRTPDAGAAGVPPAASAPFAGPGVPEGRAPDISQMSPQERFARLNDRVMQAAERGDTAFIANFTPMALGAYAQLDSSDVDSRYHAAMLHIGIRDYPAALALADTIGAQAPNNLFADLIRATIAELTGDRAALGRARAAFLQHYPSEITKSQPEYLDHRQVIDAFKEAK